MGASGFDAEFEVGGLAVAVENLDEGGGDVAVDIGTNLFPDIGKFADGEGAIDFDDVASAKEGNGCGFGVGRGGEEETAGGFFVEAVNGADLGVVLLFLEASFEAVGMGV